MELEWPSEAEMKRAIAAASVWYILHEYNRTMFRLMMETDGAPQTQTIQECPLRLPDVQTAQDQRRQPQDDCPGFTP